MYDCEQWLETVRWICELKCSNASDVFSIKCLFTSFPQSSDWKPSARFVSPGVPMQATVYNHILVHTFSSNQWLETVSWICEPRCSNAGDGLQSNAYSHIFLTPVIGNRQMDLWGIKMFQCKWRFTIKACPQSFLNTVIGNNRIDLDANVIHSKWWFTILCLFSELTMYSDWKQFNIFGSVFKWRWWFTITCLLSQFHPVQWLDIWIYKHRNTLSCYVY